MTQKYCIECGATQKTAARFCGHVGVNLICQILAMKEN